MKRFLATAESLEERSLMTAINPVLTWNATALEAIRVDKTAPPAAARDLAITQVSVFDAVNSVVPTATPYLVKLPAPAGTSVDAAAVGAAYESLVHLFPKQTALFQATLATSLASLPAGAGTTNGLVLGVAVADLELASRSADGSNLKVPYTPSTLPGLWRPTPPAFAPAVLPQWPLVTPFVLRRADQFRPGPPPLLATNAYVSNVRTVEALGAKTGSIRTPNQTQIALFWADGAGTETPPGHWNTIAASVATQQNDSTVKDARVFALLDLALADAGIACWDVKYHYNSWRPITAIREADPAQSPGLTPDPTWTPLLTTPAFPSYVSGHSTFSAAAAAVLSSVYGPHTTFTTTSDALPGVTYQFSSFNSAADQAGISRIYGGIHFPIDNTQGLKLGNSVGRYDVLHALKPLR
jgi:hypothetical protein